MVLLLKRLLQVYQYSLTELPDPRTKTWFLVVSPLELLCIVTIYLLLVLNILPKYMENRKPYDIKKLMIVYNIIQILASAYIIIKGFSLVRKLDVFCAPVDTSESHESMALAKLVWFYYMLKLLDLFDTVFFILRKKNNQVTFLHIYHHFGVILLGWVGAKYIPGGHSAYLGFVNSIVHVFMYGYYLLALVQPNNKYLMQIKKIVTQLQLIQFLLLMIVYLLPLCNMECKYPKFALLTYMPQNSLMLIMFADFYYRTYIKKIKN